MRAKKRSSFIIVGHIYGFVDQHFFVGSRHNAYSA